MGKDKKDPLHRVNDILTRLYEQMSDLTKPKCGVECRSLSKTRCCDALYCTIAKEEAEENWNEDLTPLQVRDSGLLFLGENGCTIHPKYRSTCTLHNCTICSVGFTSDENFNRRYFHLRRWIDHFEWLKEPLLNRKVFNHEPNCEKG